MRNVNNKNVLQIETASLQGFVTEVRQRKLRAIYARNNSSNLTYYAYDPVGAEGLPVMLKCDARLPELEELIDYRQQFDKNYHRNSYRSDSWSFEPRFADITLSNKRDFVRLLKFFGVDKGAVSEFSKVTIQNLKQVIDESKIEQSGETLTITKEEGLIRRRFVLAEPWEGLISEINVLIQMNKGRGNNELSYRVIVEDWESVINAIKQRHIDEYFSRLEVSVREGTMTVL